jgi:hypothetical protein
VRGKLLTTRWVFTRKDHETDPSRRYEARLVARGDHQREGIDYDVFSISVLSCHHRHKLLPAHRVYNNLQAAGQCLFSFLSEQAEVCGR